MDLGALSTHAIFSDPPMQSEAEDSSQVAEGSKRKKRNRKSKKLSEDNTEESIPPSKSPSKPKANKKAKIVELGGRYDWNIHYLALCHFGHEFNHCQVPRNTVYICEIPTSLEPNSEIIQYEGKLGRWLDDQRKAKKGRRTHLSQEKENLLQELVDQGKMVWDASDYKPNEVNKQRGNLNWPRYYQALLRYGEIYGHYNVPKRGNFQCDLPDFPDETGNTAFDAKLGNWVYWQRELQKKSGSTLTPDKEALLQALADEGKFTWDNSACNPALLSKQKSDDIWPTSYAALLKFGEEFNTYNVPDKRKYRCEFEDGATYEGNLGNWLAYQRLLKKGRRGTSLKPNREIMLQALVDTGKLHW